MPWKVTEEEIEEFFGKYAFIRESVKIGELECGRKTGHATILFENEDEATNAREEMDRQHVGSRWVRIFTMTFSEYESFADEQLGCITVNLKNILNEENLSKAVRLYGIPFDATQQ